AENIHSCHFLNSRHTFCNGTLLRKPVRTNSHSDRQNSWHGNWNSSNQENQQIVNPISVFAVLYWVHDNELNDYSNRNGTNAEVTNCCKDFLEVTNLVGAVNQMSSLAKKGVHPSGNHHCFYLTLLHG
ncbi:hypothetical protein V8G54_006119, partial [Vigna mungo]